MKKESLIHVLLHLFFGSELGECQYTFATAITCSMIYRWFGIAVGKVQYTTSWVTGSATLKNGELLVEPAVPSSGLLNLVSDDE